MYRNIDRRSLGGEEEQGHLRCELTSCEQGFMTRLREVEKRILEDNMKKSIKLSFRSEYRIVTLYLCHYGIPSWILEDI